MARAFPNSTFVGCDFHEPSIEHATTHARQGGGSGNIRFEMTKAKGFSRQGSRPSDMLRRAAGSRRSAGAAAHIHRSLMRDGTGMLMEPLAGEATEGNLGPVGRVAYAFSTMAGVIVQPDITTTANRAQIIALAAKHRLPAVYPFRFLTNEGGLASYGIDVIDGYKRSATYVDRILRGEKPGDLPVQAPIKFELSVN